MFPRRRTLSFVLTLLSINGDLVFVSSLGIGPATNVQPVLEYYPSSGSPTPQLVNQFSTVGPGNGMFTEVLPAVQRTFPGSQRLISNEALLFGAYPQGVSMNNGFPLNYAVPNTNSLTTYSTSSSYLTPVEVSNSLQVVQPTTDILTEVSITNPSQFESLTVVDQNYPPVAQTVQVEAFTPIAEVAEVYQTPINVQIPSMPQLSPFIAVATPLPEILPSQTIAQEIYTPNVLPEIYQQPVDVGIGTVSSVPVEATALGIPSSDYGYYGQQPFTLQINMASPTVPEPVITVISPQPQAVSSPSSQYDSPSLGMPPYPVVVMEKSRSKWKSILPILLLTLFDGSSGNIGGGGGGGGGGCSQCSTSIPMPYPIPIPVNNPIISGSSRPSRGKDKAKRSIGVPIN